MNRHSLRSLHLATLIGGVLLASCSREAAPPPPGVPPHAKAPVVDTTVASFDVDEEVWVAANNHALGTRKARRIAKFSAPLACGTNLLDPPLKPLRPSLAADPDHVNDGTHYTLYSAAPNIPNCPLLTLHEGDAGDGDVHGLVSFDLGPGDLFRLFELRKVRADSDETEWTAVEPLVAPDCGPGECPATCALAAVMDASPDHANGAPQPHWKLVRGGCELFVVDDLPGHQTRKFVRAQGNQAP